MRAIKQIPRVTRYGIASLQISPINQQKREMCAVLSAVIISKHQFYFTQPPKKKKQNKKRARSINKVHCTSTTIFTVHTQGEECIFAILFQPKIIIDVRIILTRNTISVCTECERVLLPFLRIVGDPAVRKPTHRVFTHKEFSDRAGSSR